MYKGQLHYIKSKRQFLKKYGRTPTVSIASAGLQFNNLAQSCILFYVDLGQFCCKNHRTQKEDPAKTLTFQELNPNFIKQIKELLFFQLWLEKLMRTCSAVLTRVCFALHVVFCSILLNRF